MVGASVCLLFRALSCFFHISSSSRPTMQTLTYCSAVASRCPGRSARAIHFAPGRGARPGVPKQIQGVSVRVSVASGPMQPSLARGGVISARSGPLGFRPGVCRVWSVPLFTTPTWASFAGEPGGGPALGSTVVQLVCNKPSSQLTPWRGGRLESVHVHVQVACPPCALMLTINKST